MDRFRGSRRWSIVLPVKRPHTAKTRLALPPALRARMARAMALDTVTAVLDCPLVAQVLIITDEPPRDFARLGATVLPDAPRAGLNAALSYGAEQAARSGTAGVAAVAADLPALRSAELTAALLAVPTAGRAVVADDSGAGTTLLAAASGVALRPAYGPGSHRRHVEGGASDVTPVSGPGLRRDVDTLADLRAAMLLGVGRYCAELLPQVAPYAVPVQATVRHYAADTRSGDVLLDDGTLLPFGSDAFDRSGLRLLRLGQRVRILIDGEGSDRRVVFLTLATFAVDVEPS